MHASLEMAFFSRDAVVSLDMVFVQTFLQASTFVQTFFQTSVVVQTFFRLSVFVQTFVQSLVCKQEVGVRQGLVRSYCGFAIFTGVQILVESQAWP